ncbi:MAG TPA: adenosylmethionine decarboxylase, partial [Bacillota bacterium]|nr:adenosylmethionine decarboxylase [Bacillota bacterium]
MTIFGRPIGTQLMAELWECNQSKIDDPQKIKATMLQAAQEAGAEIIGSLFHEFEPQGVSGVVVIAESHLAIHTWPEQGYAAVDIFTCGEHTDPWKALEYLASEFEAEETHSMEISRGMK